MVNPFELTVFHFAVYFAIFNLAHDPAPTTLRPGYQ